MLQLPLTLPLPKNTSPADFNSDVSCSLDITTPLGHLSQLLARAGVPLPLVPHGALLVGCRNKKIHNMSCTMSAETNHYPRLSTPCDY
jgi:hypothetical protein